MAGRAINFILLRLSNEQKKLGFGFQRVGMISAKNRNETLVFFQKNFLGDLVVVVLFQDGPECNASASHDRRIIPESKEETNTSFGLLVFEQVHLPEDLERLSIFFFRLNQELRFFRSLVVVKGKRH